MKRIKTTILVAILMILTSVVIGVAAESVFLKNIQRDMENSEDNLFLVEITFTILINDGCGCNPIEGVEVSAYGGAGNDQNITDIDGICVLVLEIYGEYTVTISAEGYIPVLFDFVVIDEQFFTFQMTVKDDSVSTMVPVLNHFTRILNR
jgi:hypothetical protein